MDGFRVEDGLAVGMPRSSLYSKRYHRPFHGARTETAPRNHVELCTAATLILPPDAVISHRSAALLHGIPLPRSAEPRDVDVCVFEPAHRVKARGVIGHRITPNGQRQLWMHGVRVFAPEEAWVQLGSILTTEELIVAGDYVVTGDQPYNGSAPPATTGQLESALERYGARRGARTLRSAFARIRYGSLSPQETRLRLALEDAGLPTPEPNYRVGGDDGRTAAMIDLAYPAAGVAIEYLGDHHRLTAEAYRKDIARREWLVQRGWNVVFVTAADEFGAVAERVRTALRASRGG
ncbi:hypothetical protein LLS1_31850 [Leifsonia sp. LS1]|uniref:endonuclease domain-containing protein n=1 Tax=Leifsonia sp. LS1 TaxID=2828483 RepID=UPI001CFC66B2|nr:hypothetical protein [Leifsonia sp. LS1]GIT81516.1 hypothetical protein LLS1_31850 [Leifsonia sp. LS1]